MDGSRRHCRVIVVRNLDNSLAQADLPVLWRRIEGPTWLVAAAVYGGWLALTWYHHALPWWLVLPLGGWLVGWHGGLQHEIIHGHPTRRPWVNTALAMTPIALWLPFPLYRSRHLLHHATPHLTDPMADTESFYLEPARWQRLGPGGRFLLRVHNTLAGRLLFGPATDDSRLLAGGRRAAHSRRAGMRPDLGHACGADRRWCWPGFWSSAASRSGPT